MSFGAEFESFLNHIATAEEIWVPKLCLFEHLDLSLYISERGIGVVPPLCKGGTEIKVFGAQLPVCLLKMCTKHNEGNWSALL